MATADLNGDGLLDLALPNGLSEDVFVLPGQGGGLFGAATHYDTGVPATAIAIGDLSDDGWLDLAVGSYDGDAVLVFLNESSPWEDLGGNSTGSVGAPAHALLVGWFSFQPVVFQAAGGTVHAHPFQHERLFMADATGSFLGASRWPAAFPVGTEVWFQFFAQDPASPYGFTMTNGLLATAR